MALLKLWNTLRGKRTEPAGERAPSDSDRPVETATPADESAKAKQSTPAREPAKKSGGFSKRIINMASGGPHAALCKLVRKSGATSVLEIGVGDGSRALALIKTLSESAEQGEIEYLAIDEFELSPDFDAVTGLKLREFHQTVRQSGVSPRLFPGEVTASMMRLAHTVGSVDLVVISDQVSLAEDTKIIGLLPKVTHSTSLVLVHQDDKWTPLQVQSGLQRRAA